MKSRYMLSVLICLFYFNFTYSQKKKPASTNIFQIDNITVYGQSIDNQTRCVHWHSSLDVIAIKFKCCDKYYPCFSCHEEATNHEHEVWPKDEFFEKAILCGVCGYELSIIEYMESGNSCPICKASFNPGCSNHYHLYFETDEDHETKSS
ncbi:CHY zinc finger protein [Zunongwangia endophytica]|uniref:CHY zinc finger protein n=1 Tax=Zunongwangia endophytica TaxID=1808945 RepID=A0ABV8HEY2_9FLAO|nr:CHY zinc finger protein [Zunongwangia endophytica]MDN3594134.1 CHY zinc finger protein [Zunongwangia endophytica]